MSCCPAGSLLMLGEEGYQPRGRVVRVEDLDIYVVGSGDKCVVWNYDIFGFNSGRTKELADLLAESGFLVVMPDYFRGTFQDPTKPGALEFLKRTTQWTDIKRDWETKIKPTAIQHGAKKFGSFGTCWGSYPVIRFSSLPEFVVGVSAHPSHTKISMVLGEQEADILAKISCDQLFLPAGNDGPEVKKGGLAQQMLKETLQITEFPEMNHGFLSRGDMTNPAVARDVRLAVQKIVAFFKEKF
eukprot:TRINITY_DN4481_c0_g1_i1.p1 TRINITY_DN4481_c0_g1~~TRINITY_DN4481_c0_g1_i1.p1  ORF type:complete len:242 (+),score=74.77 TRINITY_DN4481_c0_g1_i1:39-764(+)